MPDLPLVIEDALLRTLNTNRALTEAEEKLASKVTALAALHEVSRLLTTAQLPDDLYQQVAAILVDRMGYEMGLVVGLDPAGRPAVRASCACTRAQLLKLDEALAPLHLNSLEEAAVQQTLARIFAVTTLLVVSIARPGGTPEAALLVGRCHDGRDESDGRELLRTLADQVAVGLENNALYTQLARERDTLEARVAERTAELTQTLEALQSSRQRFEALVRSASDVVTIVDAAGVWRYVSPASQTVWGGPPEAFQGLPALDQVHPEDRAAASALLRECAASEGSSLAGEWRLCHAEDGWRFCQILLNNLLADPGVCGIVATYRDITERKAFETRLAHQAFHDPLSGLPNRALFLDRLERALVRAQRLMAPVAVLFLDLDNFKVINDSLGHDAGDLLLVTVAQRLQSAIRAGDTVARLGGDEFTLLLEDLGDLKEVDAVADRIAEQLLLPVHVKGREVFITGSLGIALSSCGGGDAHAMLRDADTAMYRAKTEGKARCVFFDGSMNTQAVERLELETDLHRALEQGEFRLHYQPIIHLETGRIWEVEALVRWEHPERGLIPPLKFVPIAEETGMIVPLGLWVLREACAQTRQWQRWNPSFSQLGVSVNLSARQLLQASLVDDVAQALRDTGLEPGCLKLEITESVMMFDAEATIVKLHRLKALGIRLAIDDFGTGYSSMAYLSTLPVDTLKVDRTFVMNLGLQDESEAIVRAIVTLAKTLNLSVTSEGIEEESQLDLLQSLGCDSGQGFYFSRPLPPVALGALLRAQKKTVCDTRQNRSLLESV